MADQAPREPSDRDDESTPALSGDSLISAADYEAAPVMGLGEAQGMLEDRADKNRTQAKQLTGEIRTAAQSAKDAKAGSAKVEADLASEQFPVFEEAQRAAQAHAQALQATMAIRQRAMDQLDHLDKTATMLAGDQLKDPWANASTGAKVFGTLAQMFGAFTSGVMGGPNIPAQMIQDSLKQDLAMQRFNLEHRGQNLQAQRGILSDMLRVFGDMDTAQSAAYVATKDALGRRLDMVAAKYKNPKIMAAVKEAQAALDQGALDDEVKVKQHFTDQQNELAKTEASLSAHKAAMDAATMRLNARMQGLQDWDGELNPGDRAKMATLYADTKTFGQQIADIKTELPKLDLTSPTSVARLRSRLEGLVPLLRTFFGTGANLSMNEQKNIDVQLPGVFSGTVLPSQFNALLDDLAYRQILKTTNELRARKLTPRPGEPLTQALQAFTPGAQ